MKKVFILCNIFCFFYFCSLSLASQEPIDYYKDAKQTVLNAEKDFNQGNQDKAEKQYQEALNLLLDLQRMFPNWSSMILVEIQKDKCKDKLKEIQALKETNNLKQNNVVQEQKQEIIPEVVVKKIEKPKLVVQPREEKVQSLQQERRRDIVKDPNYEKFLDISRKADGFLATENYDAAINGYNQALTIYPKDKFILVNKAVALYKKGNLKDALEIFNKLIKEDIGFAPAYYNLADIYYSVEEYSKAADFYSKAIEFDPGDIRSKTNLGVVYVKTGSYNKAIDLFKEVLEINPDSPESHFNLGVIYSDYFFDKEKALFHYSKYLEINPYGSDAETVKQWIEMLKKETGKNSQKV